MIWPLSPETTAAIHLHYGHVGNSRSTKLHSSCCNDYLGIALMLWTVWEELFLIDGPWQALAMSYNAQENNLKQRE
ncbi:hypothetical protein QL285_038950 [Trifolium repens]|nr:hypothetical protein QL285_038950 [Trifolium repens]